MNCFVSNGYCNSGHGGESVRRNWKIGFPVVLAFIACTALTGCGGLNSMTASKLNKVPIQVTPSLATIASGQSEQFQAFLPWNPDHAVTWSVCPGVSATPESCNKTAQTGTAQTGTIAQNGLYVAPTGLTSPITVTIFATGNVSGQPSGSAALTVTPAPPAPTTPGPKYGSKIGFDVLNNQPVSQGDVDYRFRAATSGLLTSFLWYDVYKEGGATPGCSGKACECDGYGCGTGGAIEICIYTDDGTAAHLPTDSLTQAGTGAEAAPLACVSPANLRSGAVLRQDAFVSPPMLVKGTLYHLHWHNADPDPTANFISVDDDCVWHPTTPRQPTVADSDMAVLSIYNDGTKIVANEVATDTPIFQLNYDDGSSQGQGYIGSWNSDAQEISGGSAVREVIKVSSASVVVDGLNIRVNRVSGNSPLIVTLADASGATVEQGEIQASMFPLGPALTNDPKESAQVQPAWGSYVFKTARTLNLNESYSLTLTAAADTRYQAYGIEKGSAYGFGGDALFVDGLGQFSIDNGSRWSGFTQPDGTATGSVNHRNADIQFYFTTVQ